jgi:hypothetical protein
MSDYNAYREELGVHLQKLWLDAKTCLISLSADFRWVINKAIYVSRETDMEEMRISAFSVSEIDQAGHVLSNVVEDIDFFYKCSGDQDQYFKRRDKQSLRSYAQNAKEWVCCDSIPTQACITTVKVSDILKSQWPRYKELEPVWLNKKAKETVLERFDFYEHEELGFLRYAFILAESLNEIEFFRNYRTPWYLPGDTQRQLPWQDENAESQDDIHRRLTGFIKLFMRPVKHWSGAALLARDIAPQTAGNLTGWAFSPKKNYPDVALYSSELLELWREELDIQRGDESEADEQKTDIIRSVMKTLCISAPAPTQSRNVGHPIFCRFADDDSE